MGPFTLSITYSNSGCLGEGYNGSASRIDISKHGVLIDSLLHVHSVQDLHLNKTGDLVIAYLTNRHGNVVVIDSVLRCLPQQFNGLWFQYLGDMILYGCEEGQSEYEDDTTMWCGKMKIIKGADNALWTERVEQLAYREEPRLRSGGITLSVDEGFSDSSVSLYGRKMHVLLGDTSAFYAYCDSAPRACYAVMAQARQSGTMHLDTVALPRLVKDGGDPYDGESRYPASLWRLSDGTYQAVVLVRHAERHRKSRTVGVSFTHELVWFDRTGRIIYHGKANEWMARFTPVVYH